MPRDVAAAVPDALEAAERSPPADARMHEIAQRLPVRLEEEQVVIHLAGAHEFLAQSQLALQHADGARTQNYSPVVGRLGRVLVDAIDARLGEGERAERSIVIADE